MSVWTHVAAVFRIDGCALFDDDDSIADTIGKECLLDMPEEVWRDCEENPSKYLPCGSEGSLQKVVWVNPDPHNMARYSVMVFGDLRDFDNTNYVKEWFNKVCDNSWIRQAIINIECYPEDILLKYDPSESGTDDVYEY